MSLSKKDILKNINVTNIILTLALILFIFMVVLPSYRTDVTTPTFTATNESGHEHTRIEESPEKEVPQPADYSVIAEENLFHPDRKLVVSKKDSQPIQNPNFVLYGTLIAGDVKVAYIEDTRSLYSTTGRGRRQRALHIGEELSGYILSEIYNEKVVMVRGEERIEVRVAESSKQKHEKITTAKPKKPKELKQQKAIKQMKKRVRRLRERR